MPPSWVPWSPGCLCKTRFHGLPRCVSSPNQIHRIFGGQQSAALKVGLLGAYVGRGLMLVLANLVIQNRVAQIDRAAIYLIKLGFENLGQAEPGEEARVEERADRAPGLLARGRIC